MRLTMNPGTSFSALPVLIVGLGLFLAGALVSKSRLAVSLVILVVCFLILARLTGCGVLCPWVHALF